MATEYVIYCDESDASGKHFANFYGGALVRSTDIEVVNEAIASKKHELHFNGEVKWQKVTGRYLEKYVELMDLFLDLIAEDKVKIRIMFTQQYYRPVGLTKTQRDNAYFLLYYQFIKHAFGLAFSNPGPGSVNLRINFDQLPDTREKCEQFKGYIAGLNHYGQFERAGIRLPREQIAEVDSKNHDLLQCMDVVLGAMQFKLNDKHKEKPEGQWRRGKRTVAKEKLYKHINRRIRQIYPRFNIGVSTATQGDKTNRWRHPYRHWLFMPSNWVTDKSAVKGKK